MYARALFQAAQEHGRLAEAREELADFVTTVRAVPELAALLRNPEIDRAAKADALGEILRDADELVRNFVRVLVDKGRETQLEEIHREFESLVAAAEQRLEVELTTAVELSDDEAERIVSQIEEAS